jgi:hypothetical protein
MELQQTWKKNDAANHLHSSNESKKKRDRHGGNIRKAIPSDRKSLYHSPYKKLTEYLDT